MNQSKTDGNLTEPSLKHKVSKKRGRKGADLFEYCMSTQDRINELNEEYQDKSLEEGEKKQLRNQI